MVTELDILREKVRLYEIALTEITTHAESVYYNLRDVFYALDNDPTKFFEQKAELTSTAVVEINKYEIEIEEHDSH